MHRAPPATNPERHKLRHRGVKEPAGLRREPDPAVQAPDLSGFLCCLRARQGRGAAEPAPARSGVPTGSAQVLAAQRCPSAAGGGRGEPAQGDAGGSGMRSAGCRRHGDARGGGCLGAAEGWDGQRRIARRRSEPSRPPAPRNPLRPARRRPPAPRKSPPPPSLLPRGRRRRGRTVGSSGSICAPWSWVSMRRRGRGGGGCALPGLRGAARLRWRGGRKRRSHGCAPRRGGRQGPDPPAGCGRGPPPPPGRWGGRGSPGEAVWGEPSRGFAPPEGFGGSPGKEGGVGPPGSAGA